MKRRDLEILSAYLDGELKPSDSIKLEARLKTDLELASVLSDLRATRTLLRKLPTRKAPRNFTLTRKMVGQNPPVPRSYPIFRLATIVATLLFFFSFGINSFGSQMAQSRGFGMGGGNDTESADSLAAEAPMIEGASPAMEEPAAPAEPPEAFAPQATDVSPIEDSQRITETPSSKNGETENAVEDEPVQAVPSVVPYSWQIGLAVIAFLGVLLMGLTRQISARRWK